MYLWKLWSQLCSLHLYNFVCVCRQWCSRQFPLDVNALSQNLHLNGRSPVCILSCTWKLDLFRNSFPHTCLLPKLYLQYWKWSKKQWTKCNFECNVQLLTIKYNWLQTILTSLIILEGTSKFTAKVEQNRLEQIQLARFDYLLNFLAVFIDDFVPSFDFSHIFSYSTFASYYN